MKKLLQKPSNTILVSYAAASLFIIIDILISHDGLTANDGFSFYGGFARTVILYTLALLFVAFGFYRVSKTIRLKQRMRLLSDVFIIMMFCIVGLVLTPHTILNPIHTFFGALLFAIQLLLMVYIAWISKSFVAWVAVVLMFFFGILALLYLYPDVGYELEAQAGFQISFALGLNAYFRRQKQ